MDHFDNAQNALETVRNSLQSLGESDTASALIGLEIYSASSANAALEIVTDLRTRSVDAEFARLDALCALKQAVKMSSVAAA